MQRLLPHVLVAVLLVGAAVAATPATHPKTKPSPKPSPLASIYPEIGHVVSRPFCSALRSNIGPAIGALLQNDRVIGRGTPLFNTYNMARGEGDMGDSRRQLTLVQMENLVGPMVKNVAGVEDALHDATVFRNPPRNDDDKRLLDMREKLENVLAMQKASLDIINGFVTTQQLADMQHEGFGYIGAITGNETTNKDPRATPNPLLQDPDQAGLTPDPHFIDPANIPGLTLGYNPVTRLRDGLEWTRRQAHAGEDVASRPVIEAIHICNIPMQPQGQPQNQPQQPAATPTPEQTATPPPIAIPSGIPTP